MYGWRARIGVLVPSANTVVESEFNRMIPEGVSVHAARMYKLVSNPDTEIEMRKEAQHATRELATAKCDTLLYACTSGSFVGGHKWEADLVDEMEQIAGVKCLTASGALSSALKIYGKKKISIITPYCDGLTKLLHSYFTSEGYEVLSVKGLGIEDNVEIGKQPPSVSFSLAKQVPKETELLVISCTDFRTIENIEILEKDLGIPVVSSNQASLWAALRICGVREHVKGFGSLFLY